MKEKILKIWHNISFYIARITVYISLVLVYFFIKFYPLTFAEDHICPLCGMTRATTCLLKFKFREAYTYNNNVIFILILIIFIIFDISSFTFYYLKNKINK